MWTGIMARVFSVILLSTSSGSSWYEAGSKSANTGRARADRIPWIVPGSVYGVVITSSPALMPKASTQVCRAWVPEPVATQKPVGSTVGHAVVRGGCAGAGGHAKTGPHQLRILLLERGHGAG